MQDALHLITDTRLDALVERTARRVAEMLRDQDSDREREATALLTAQDVCERLRIGPTTLWKLRRAGRLPSVGIGRAVRFRPSDVDAVAQSVASSAL